MTQSGLSQYLATAADAPTGSTPLELTRRRIPAIAWLGAVILLFYVGVALLAPWLAPYDPHSIDAAPLLSPDTGHVLGTNDIGQDIFSEIIYGARISLLVATVTSLLVIGLATTVGTLAGYGGGGLDTLLMRLVDVMLAIPRLPLMIVIAAYAGSGLLQIILIIAFFSWPMPTRLIRAEVLSLRSRQHIQAARTFGGSPRYMITRHLIPALMPILMTTLAVQASRAVIMEAGLAFLGLGDPTAKSWGLIIRAALSFSGIYFGNYWVWWLLPAGLNLTLMVLAFTFLGQGLETWANPRTERH